MRDPMKKKRGTAVRTKLSNVSQTMTPTPLKEEGSTKSNPMTPTMPRATAIQTPATSRPMRRKNKISPLICHSITSPSFPCLIPFGRNHLSRAGYEEKRLNHLHDHLEKKERATNGHKNLKRKEKNLRRGGSEGFRLIALP